MIVELRGVEFVNKGAELMLHAIMQQVKAQFPKAVFAMEPTKRVSAEQLALYKIYEKKGRRAMVIPKFLRRRLRLALDKEINVVLDGSGFAFGDQWGGKHAEKKLGQRVVAWHKQGKKVILLPQAFGPFSDPELKTIMEKIVAHTDLIFAREEQSFRYLQTISTSSHISKAPDFTNLIEGRVPQGFDVPNMQVAVIPNRKMIDKKDTGGTQYIHFLHEAIHAVRSQGLKPYFLIHEGPPDVEIAQGVNALLEQPLQIIINTDPLMIKGIISTARFIICSRFHGIVSALSQGIPCISTSWSHKYEMLHQEYEYEEGLIKDLTHTAALLNIISKLAHPEEHKKLSEHLLRKSAVQKQRSADMWHKVFACMQPR